MVTSPKPACATMLPITLDQPVKLGLTQGRWRLAGGVPLPHQRMERRKNVWPEFQDAVFIQLILDRAESKAAHREKALRPEFAGPYLGSA